LRKQAQLISPAHGGRDLRIRPGDCIVESSESHKYGQRITVTKTKTLARQPYDARCPRLDHLDLHALPQSQLMKPVDLIRFPDEFGYLRNLASRQKM
jgi:hypothetical protein